MAAPREGNRGVSAAAPATAPAPAARREERPVAGGVASGRAGSAPRFAHLRIGGATPGGAASEAPPQQVWIGFGGRADQPWLRALRPGFRHCFAALRDAGGGWTVLDPLSGRLVVARLDLPPDFDLPRAWRRAGFAVLGPFTPGPARRRWLPPLAPFTCVALCRALLGAGAPFALTPRGLFRRLRRRLEFSRKKFLTTPAAPV
mgnify:CR=1 FL=1